MILYWGQAGDSEILLVIFKNLRYILRIMARRHRFHSPTSTYHVILRGNDSQPIFFSEGDKTKLCLLIQQGVERFGHNIEAFCFMSNHIHLTIRVADVSISRIMQHLAFRYTQYINRRYKRGHFRDVSSLFWLMMRNISKSSYDPNIGNG
jgi:REP element-mobilizing transposase RayT